MKFRILWIAFGLSLLSTVNAEDWFTIWSNAGSTWHERWINLLGRSDEFDDSTKIELFSRALGVKSPYRKMNEEQEDIYLTVQALLISIPGHSEFYERRIRGEWEAFQEAWERDPEKADASRFLNGVRYDFPVLEHLPSAENVRNGSIIS